MVHREFDIWCAYRNKYGPLNPIRMYDAGAALVASQINRSHGGKAQPRDFMPYGRGSEPEIDLSDNRIIDMLVRSGQAKVGR